MADTVRVAAAQVKRRTIPYKTPRQDALAQVRASMEELAGLAERAAEMGCQIVGFPEDTLGTLEWEAGHWDEIPGFLRTAEEVMLARFGEVAAKHNIYIACCNDCAEGDTVYNTAILIGPDGNEVGRYRKVQPTLSERARALGKEFPVFDLPGIGTVGMCICYDMVFPETTRALALGGADVVFHLTLGGASSASRDASLAAFKTRAAENYIYLVVAFRGGNSMVISPKGEILAEAGREQDAIVFADIDPAGGRETGDALGGLTSDFRARLFRERNPEAYRILVDENPPVLEKLKHIPVPSVQEATALMAEGLTTGSDAFYEADRLLSEGKTDEAKQRFEKLSEHFGTLWIGRASRERLQKIAESGKAS